MRRGIRPKRRDVFFGISHSRSNLGPKKESRMKMQFLTIAAALAGVFAAQSAFAFQKELPTSYTNPTSSHKHHKKHHMKKKSKAQNTAVPTAEGAVALS
jgi:hypothetical protein